MSVNILLITHDEIGKTLLVAAVNTLGFCPLSAELLSVPLDCDPQKIIDVARDTIKMLDTGDGVLVLTDIYGSTPSNIACNLLTENKIRVISGINLPMLIRVFNYPTLELDELVLKAVSGGKEGIMACNTSFE